MNFLVNMKCIKVYGISDVVEIRLVPDCSFKLYKSFVKLSRPKNL